MRVTNDMQMPSLEATEKSLPCTFLGSGICILSDTDILLNFLRVCELQRHSLGIYSVLTEGCLMREGEKELAGEGRAHTTG